MSNLNIQNYLKSVFWKSFIIFLITGILVGVNILSIEQGFIVILIIIIIFSGGGIGNRLRDHEERIKTLENK